MPVDTLIATQGDCWDSIAYKLWGDEHLLDALRRANPKHLDTVVFAGGEKLAVPERPVDAVAKEGMPPWRTL